MPNVATFLRKDTSIVKIESIPLDIMKKYRQLKRTDKEAGGIILGRMIQNSHDVIIDQITVPAVHDRRSRFSFFRSRFIQTYINLKWHTSEHTQNYLGEWHTHPEPHPLPSGTDIKNWQEVLHKSVIDQEFLIFLIVGQVTISAWELCKLDTVLYQLRPGDQT